MNIVIMNPCILVLALVTFSKASTVGDHTEDVSFCYSDPNGCGPNTDAWSPICHTGIRQSPISLPAYALPVGSTQMQFSAYKGSSFRIQNNGHSVQFDFNGQGPSTALLTFPDPLRVYCENQEARLYRFAAAHFHWGVNDAATGSEHCIGAKCAAMELHLVHYLAEYPSMAEAVSSEDVNALAVIGVLIDVDTGTDLDSIANHLPSVEYADHEGTHWVTLNEPLDLSEILQTAAKDGMYTYRGSLTTPGCNEQVNWYVLKNPAVTSHQDLEAFRTIIKDGEGKVLTENHRPLQTTNGRKILFSEVVPY